MLQTTRSSHDIFTQEKGNQMLIEQIYTSCLAQASYYLESEGEAIIIDPLRDPSPYLRRAEESGANIKYILETHFHADYVSGHEALAKEADAFIVFGPTARAEFVFHEAEHKELLYFGNATIEVLHTPGHTMESVCFLLKDEFLINQALFTGDTLFLGDVGRPDLAVKSDLTSKDLAKLLYRSIYSEILPLEDSIIIYPGHGAGSACGKKMSKSTHGTLGEQRQTNYALQNLSENEFIEQVLSGIPSPPRYFPKNVQLNREGVQPFSDVLHSSDIAIDTVSFELLAAKRNTILIDTRSGNHFAKGHIPNSINIGLGGDFASWVGTLVEDLKQPILLVCDLGHEVEAITRLSRVGYDGVIGYLKGGISEWIKSGKMVDFIEQIQANELRHHEATMILDVRKDEEFKVEHLKCVSLTHIPLDQLISRVSELKNDASYYIHCAGGYRSLIACSWLKARGFHQVVNIKGGFEALKMTDLVRSDDT